MKKVSFIVDNKEGLHARPASAFVNVANSCESNIIMIKNDNAAKEYSGKSIISLISMACIKGDKITIIADGTDEERTINKLIELVESDFS